MKTREFARRVLTDIVSMTPWPLEMAGTFVLWHYGKLFSSSLEISRDYSAIIAQIMQGDTWGLFARGLAYALFGLGTLRILTGAELYVVRVIAAVAGLLVWGVLTYSCWRSGVPVQIYELYAFFIMAQAYTAMLLQTRRRAEKDDV